jgi:hypothetical protein
LFSGAIEQRAGLSFGTFLFPAEKKSTSLTAGNKGKQDTKENTHENRARHTEYRFTNPNPVIMR